MLIKVKDGQKLCLLASFIFFTAYIGANCANSIKRDSENKLFHLESEFKYVPTVMGTTGLAGTTSGNYLMTSSALAIGIVGLSL